MTALAALIGALVGLAASPYLSALTLSVPDREQEKWWRWQPVGSARTSAVAVIALLLATLAGLGTGMSAAFFAQVALALVMTPLVVIDFETKRLPNRLVFSGGIGEMLLLTATALTNGQWTNLLRSVEAGALLYGVFFLVVFLAPRSFGFGDVKLLGVLGLMLGWFGWIYLYYGIFAGFVLGSIVGFAQLATRRGTLKSQIPFGPSLIFGAFLAVALHRLL